MPPTNATSSATTGATAIASSLQITDKPLLDDREYRLVTLQNGLEALLIHDPDTDKASAALDVNVGSFADPDDLPGLAHFCEHLLFMGTEKYPTENEYSSYLSAHTGQSNAYTAADSTNYYFEVGHEHFYGALDRFSHFFVSPLFSPSCKDREIRAVDSENKNNLQNDLWRLHQIERSLSNPAHPNSKFSTGNINTLETLPAAQKVDVRDRLLEFYASHYSSNIMKLVLIGRESLDTLQDWTADLFSPIKNTNKPKPEYDVPVLTDKELGILIQAKPVKESKRLLFRFPLPDQQPLYESKPAAYLSFTIGHEGPGSILYLLKEKGWANALSSGAAHISKNQDQFIIDIDLTEKGLAEYKQIIDIVFQYIQLLQTQPIAEYIFHEQKAISEVDFKYRPKKSAFRTTSYLAAQMQKPLARESLLSSTVFTKYDEDLIREQLGYLTPDNFRTLLVAQNLKGLDQQEKWYGTPYRVDPLEPAYLEHLKNLAPNPDLALPEPNVFIPDSFDVEKKTVDTPLKFPHLIRNQKQLKVWYKKDDTFWTPKADVRLYFQAPITYASPANFIKTLLYFSLVEDTLSQFAYAAEVAGLSYSVGPSREGFSITVSGYNDKIGVLLEQILRKLRDYKVEPLKFDVWKERTLRTYNNIGFSNAYMQLSYHYNYLLSENVWTLDERQQALENTTFEEVSTFGEQILKKLDVEIVAVGNLYKHEVLQIADHVFEILKPEPVPDTQSVKQRSFWLPPGTEYNFEYTSKDEKNVNSCTEFFIQVAKLTEPRQRVVLELFAAMASEPAFNQLRTREQLGYIVFSGTRMTRTSVGFRMLVQSERTSALLKQRMDRFLVSLGEIIENYSDEQFNKYVASLISKKQEKFKNLGEEADAYNVQISSGYYNFGVHEEDVEALQTVTKREVLDLFYKVISPQAKDRAVLVASHNAVAPPAMSASQVTGSVFTALALKHDIKLDPAEAAELLGKADGKTPEQVLQLAQATLEAKGYGDIAPKFLAEAAEEIVLQTAPEAQARPGSVNVESVSWFKARLQLTEAPVPWKDLTEYMETESKL